VSSPITGKGRKTPLRYRSFQGGTRASGSRDPQTSSHSLAPAGRCPAQPVIPADNNVPDENVLLRWHPQGRRRQEAPSAPHALEENEGNCIVSRPSPLTFKRNEQPDDRRHQAERRRAINEERRRGGRSCRWQPPDRARKPLQASFRTSDGVEMRLGIARGRHGANGNSTESHDRQRAPNPHGQSR
jgi:hypothetical protein